MPRWLEIALTLVLFTAGMAILSWGVNATVPAGVDWIADRIGDVAFLAIFGALMLICAYLGWRGHRPTKGGTGRLDGR